VDDDPVLLEVKGGVAVLSLNRPDKHNAMADAVDALFFRYLDLLRSDRDVRVVVWRGNGPSFSAGRDVAELLGDDALTSVPVTAEAAGNGNGFGNGTGDGDGKANGKAGNGKRDGNGNDGSSTAAAAGAVRTTGEHPVVGGREPGDTGPGGRPLRADARRHGFGASDFELLDRTHWGTRLLYDFPVPIICALKGWTLGTSFERALLCDVRVAGEGARMALASAEHGVIPDSAGVAKLYEIGGAGLALDLALTGRLIDAPEALRLGIVSQVVPDDDLDEAALDVAHAIAARPPLVVRLVREHVQALASPGVRGTLGRELVGQAMLLASHDFHEQHRARAEDRAPRYERR
jgi:enoyl-CoA hydratase/carnithine racemase